MLLVKFQGGLLDKQIIVQENKNFLNNYISYTCKYRYNTKFEQVLRQIILNRLIGENIKYV